MRWYDFTFDQMPLWEGVTLDIPLLERFAVVVQDALDTAIPGLSLPILVMLGRHDYLLPPANWDAFGTKPNVTVHVFERSGHNPMYEEPEAFDAALTSWLAATGTR